MGDINEEWEIEEEGSLYAEETKSNASWIMSKGLNIGKKIVITGVVISSAPLVLPPLIVIFALGFAFSLLSGILLSSYTCTKKLMSKLLPIADEEYYYWKKDFENNEEGQDNLEEEKEYGSAMGYDYVEEDFGKYLETRGIEEEPLTNRAKVEQPSDHDGVSVTKEEIPIENKGVEKKIYGEKLPTFETDIKENIQETQDEKKIDAHIREGTQEVEAQRKGRPVEGKNDEEDVGVTVVAEKTIINGNEPSKKAAKKRKGNKKQDAGAGDEELQKKKEDEKVVHSTNDIINKTPQDTAELPSSAKVPEPKQAAAAIPTGKEVRLGEEKIREKLDALQEILGYKASSTHRTYAEELGALYIFTGIEPPASLKDSSDLVEVNDKLDVLMSIVGVK